MKTKSNKILSLFLAVAILLSCVAVATLTVVSNKANVYAEGEMPATEELAAVKALDSSNTGAQSFLMYPYAGAKSETYYNVNGTTVKLDLLKFHTNEIYGNNSFAEAEVIFNTIRYKLAHPTEEVYLDFSSYRFSIGAAACVDMNNPKYGTMKQLFDSNFTISADTGRIEYIRLSYLMVLAAKCGVHVRTMAQLNGYYLQDNVVGGKLEGYKQIDEASFLDYMNGFLTTSCYELEGLSGKTVGDFLTNRRTEWIVVERSASDMMHYKSCASSAIIDNRGAERKNVVWLSSQNLDGINVASTVPITDYNNNHPTVEGSNGNNNMQTGVVIYGHDDIYRVCKNYYNIQWENCEQEDADNFRFEVRHRNAEQFELINSGHADQIPADEQILYLGSATDNVFEMYFTPLVGSTHSFDKRYNPFAKYTAKMLNSEDWIAYSLYNVKFNHGTITEAWTQMIVEAFKKNQNVNNKLRIHCVDNLYGADNWFTARYDFLEVGKNIGFKEVQYPYQLPWLHNKDITVSWKENGVRQYVVVQTSLNIHSGAFAYQSNYMLVVHENEQMGHKFYDDYCAWCYVWDLPQ